MADSHALPSLQVSEQLALEERARFLVAEAFGDRDAIAAIREGLKAEQAGMLVAVKDLKRKYVAQ